MRNSRHVRVQRAMDYFLSRVLPGTLWVAAEAEACTTDYEWTTKLPSSKTRPARRSMQPETRELSGWYIHRSSFIVCEHSSSVLRLSSDPYQPPATSHQQSIVYRPSSISHRPGLLP